MSTCPHCGEPLPSKLDATLVRIEQTCFGCPSSWEALDSTGSRYDIRYRHGRLSVDVDDCEEFVKIVDRMADGVMGLDEMLRHTGLTVAPGA